MRMNSDVKPVTVPNSPGFPDPLTVSALPAQVPRVSTKPGDPKHPSGPEGLKITGWTERAETQVFNQSPPRGRCHGAACVPGCVCACVYVHIYTHVPTHTQVCVYTFTQRQRENCTETCSGNSSSPRETKTQKEPAVEHRELYSIVCNGLYGNRI